MHLAVTQAAIGVGTALALWPHRDARKRVLLHSSVYIACMVTAEARRVVPFGTSDWSDPDLFTFGGLQLMQFISCPPPAERCGRSLGRIFFWLIPKRISILHKHIVRTPLGIRTGPCSTLLHEREVNRGQSRMWAIVMLGPTVNHPVVMPRTITEP